VYGIDLTEIGAHLADLEQESRRKRSKSDVSLFHVDARFTKGDEGVGTSVGIDDGLHAHFGLMQLQRARRGNHVAARRANEVPDQADVWVEELGVGGCAAKGLRLDHLRRSRLGGGRSHRGRGKQARLEM
jgi:hypothetical protein